MSYLSILGIILLCCVGYISVVKYILREIYPYLPAEQIETLDRVQKRIHILHAFGSLPPI